MIKIFSRQSSEVFAGLLLVTLANSSFGAGPRNYLHGQIPAAAARLNAVDALPATNQLQLAIGLPLRNQTDLDALLQQIYNPSSARYRQYLTPQEFTQQFGPTVQDYQAVIDFARKNGLRVTGTHPNRVVLDVAGSVADVERVFRLKMRLYKHPKENRKFFAPDAEPSVDASLPVSILSISGLDDYSLPHPANLHVMPITQLSGVTPNAGSGPGGTYQGKDFRTAYAPGTSLNGTGESIAMVQFDGYYASDIVSYLSGAGLPATAVTLSNVAVNGGIGTPGSGAIEVSLDIEMAISMATNATKIYVYEAPNGTAWTTMLNKIANDNLARQISCSWGGGSGTLTAEQIFQQMAAQGQSFFTASGDSDAYAGSIPFPEESPSITQVGGTTLTTASESAAYVSETAWNRGNGIGTGGGISPNYAIPTWQRGINSFLGNGGSTTNRNCPDVALTAENVFVVYGNGHSGSVGGTSVAAPLWAGFMALVNQSAASNGQPPVGFINPAVYEIANESIYQLAFNDIIAGNNTSSKSFNAFFAVTNYDLCTGVGTPGGTNLINALVNPDPLVIVSNCGFNAVGTATKIFNISSQTFFLTNIGASSLDWSVINTTEWLNVSNPGGTLTTGAGDAVVIGLNSIASNLVAGIYSGSVLFSNMTSRVSHSRLFTLKTSDPLILSTNKFFFTGPPGGPFDPAYQGITFINPSSGNLNWSLNNTSALFSVSAASGNIPPGSQASLTITPTAAASNIPDGYYSAILQVTNLASQFVQVVTGLVVVGLVENGGFETGDVTGWTLAGRGYSNGTLYNGVVSFNSLTDGSGPNFIHSGSYGVFLGDTTLATLSQTIPTIPGQIYRLSLWLDNPVSGSGQQFFVNWNTNGTSTNQIYSLISPSVLPWTNLVFMLTATGTNSTIQFQAQNRPNGFGLDDISLMMILPPTITAQPTNLTMIAGSSASFSATVSGSVPLTYQWRQYGTNVADQPGVSGTASPGLTLTGITSDSAADYTLFVTNAYGSVTSSVATLTVALPPAVVTALINPTIECGSNASFAISASGTPPLTYQWSIDSTPVSDATNNSLALVDIHLPSHMVTVIVSNLYGSLTNSVLVTVQDTLAPVMTLNGPDPIFLELGAAFSDPGAAAYDSCAGPVTVNSSGPVNPNIVGTNLLTYSCADGNGNNSQLLRAVIVRDTTPPTIVWSFTNSTQAADSNCSGTMPDITGTNYIVATDLSGQLTFAQYPTNNSVLVLGTNLVVITVADASGNDAYSTNTIVVQDETPPQILAQPQSRTNLAGSVAGFNVTATACTPRTYQWFFNGNSLTDATNRHFIISPVNQTNAGNYFVTITSAGGSTNTITVTLSVTNDTGVPDLTPKFTGVSFNPDGSFTLNIVGAPGSTYVLETSTNLIPFSIWQPIATNTLGNSGFWQYIDQQAVNFRQQFYWLKLAQ